MIPSLIIYLRHGFLFQVVTTVSEVPEESCDIVPSKICKYANTLLPHLVPVEKCSDLPRQICSFGLKSPTLSDKPLITKWCFDPSEEDELNDLNDDDFPETPEIFRSSSELPELSPIEVEDVLIFADDNQLENTNEKLSELRNGKKLHDENSVEDSANQNAVFSHVNDNGPIREQDSGVNNRIDPEVSIKSSEEPNETSVQEHDQDVSPEEFLEQQVQEKTDKDQNIVQTEVFSEGIDHNQVDDHDEENENQHFASILSQLNRDFRYI